MLPYGVGADSISARAIWGNAKPHGRTLCAPTRVFQKTIFPVVETVGANSVRPHGLTRPPNSPVGKVKRQIPLAYLCLM